jgi:3-hydroxyacyl-CoA dehydrogenase/enoyl-CoA hydratase/3-hydroxybutyryl-CoA epimerase/3-hydroxyacyl-CoA dehydrogenase/enoyl-CoA hydratase/3-hydroxybutyryl-CoA epimerase/enoyl-CoA isomerase
MTMNQPGDTPSALRLEVRESAVAVVTFDLPGSRANTLGMQILAEFETLLAMLRGRANLRGLILCSGKPGMFIAGADLRELGSVKPDPDKARALVKRGLNLIASFEELPYPTVAAIDGACMGGGLELALGFDYRLAGSHPKAELAFPEVKIGLFPGWGGTQRVMRAIGVPLAIEMVCSGDSINAQRARERGLVFDVVPSERLMDEAIRLIDWTHQSGDWKELRRRKRQPVGLSEDQHSFTFAVARAQVLEKTKGQLPAPLVALDVMEKSCNLPLGEGLKVETEHFVPLVGSPISRNLIAIFFMTQKLAKDPGVANTSIQPGDIRRVGVIGAGLMGSGIAGAHIRRGIHSILIDGVPAALEKGMASITRLLQSRVDAGRMKPEEMLAAMSRLTPTTALTPLIDRDLIVEAIVENEESKVRLFQDLEKFISRGTLLASNTSTISITRMARSLSLPGRFAGMHFFNPVDRMPLVEVIRGEKTADATVATLVALARKLGKTPIVVRDCPGFLVNRILFPYLNESLVLLEEGGSPRAIDQAAVAFGMPMGPVTLNDFVGLDTSLYAGRVINLAFADRAAPTRILDELVGAGRLGRKAGAGFYNYAKSSQGADDPAFDAILERVRTGRRSITQEEITDRLFLPMLTEASRVLMEGIVREPADVDMGLILGIGFPGWRGGLLRWADSLGLPTVLEKLTRYESLGRRFQPTEQMQQLAQEGKGFYKDQE